MLTQSLGDGAHLLAPTSRLNVDPSVWAAPQPDNSATLWNNDQVESLLLQADIYSRLGRELTAPALALAPRHAPGVATRAAAGGGEEVAEAAVGGVPSELEADGGMDVEVDPSLVLDAGVFDAEGFEADSGKDVEVDPSLVLDAAALVDDAGFAVQVDPIVSASAHIDA